MGSGKDKCVCMCGRGGANTCVCVITVFMYITHLYMSPICAAWTKGALKVTSWTTTKLDHHTLHPQTTHKHPRRPNTGHDPTQDTGHALHVHHSWAKVHAQAARPGQSHLINKVNIVQFLPPPIKQSINVPPPPITQVIHSPPLLQLTSKQTPFMTTK